MKRMTKSANMRASLIPYLVIAIAVGGNTKAVNWVIQRYSGCIATLSTRTSYDKNVFSLSLVDEGRYVQADRNEADYLHLEF